MLKKYFILFLFILGCSQFVKNTDDSYFKSLDPKSKSEYLHIGFSHNINGETHPCGCRSHPLGGLPQIAGIQHQLKQLGPLLYVDSGDAFFPSPVIPKYVQESQIFTAHKIAQAFDQLGLKYFVPGDQDFAMGEEFLIELANKHQFEFLLTNASTSNKIPHKTWALHRFGKQKIVLLGVTRPDLLNKYKDRNLFVSPKTAIKKSLAQIKKDIGALDELNIILISHSGLDYDKKLAQAIPELDWIIGAHSQSFLRYSTDVKETKIVQVLSRNHYFGHIKLPAHTQAKEHYQIIEVRDETKDQLKPNPFIAWLKDYKAQLEKIQIKEQDRISGVDSSEIKPLATAQSCLQCHSAQTQFWQKTPHSLAYVTLKKANAENNPNCIGCHSLGFKQVDGFTHTASVVKVDKKNKDRYWKEWNQIFKKVKSPRKLAANKIKTHSQKWFKLDQKFNINHNYANVQCLNCHTKQKDHPFAFETIKTKNWAKRCTTCHTQDQSPSWYSKNDKGIATKLNKKYFAQKLKKVACPKE